MTMDTGEHGSDSMKILIKETQFSDNISTIKEKVYKRSTAVSSSMFTICSILIFTKKRGYSHAVMLDHSTNHDCDDCE